MTLLRVTSSVGRFVAVRLTRDRYFGTTGVQQSNRICVVGAGPAGFYASQYILKHLPSSSIDIIEKLPVPFGLVR